MRGFFYGFVLLGLFLYFVGIVPRSLPAVSPWMVEQVKEDLSFAPTESWSREELRAFFQDYDGKGAQALYCSIQGNRVTWKSAIHTDHFRNPHIFDYLEHLSRHYTLPDTEFILISDDGTGLAHPFPVFAFSKVGGTENVCLFPDFEMLWELKEKGKNWIPICQRYTAENLWETKKERAFFRGASTGTYDPSLVAFGNDRVRLTLFSQEHPDRVDATLSQIWQPAIGDLLASVGKEAGGASIQNHFQYKYLFDVDGNASTYSRGRWVLLSNSVLLKVMGGHTQWYYKALEPLVHFMPIHKDLSNLIATLDWLQSHDKEAKEMAERATLLGEELFSQERVDQYVVHLFQEYAKRLRS